MISLVYTAYAVDPGNPRTLTTEPKPNSQFSVLWLVSKWCNIVAIVLFFDLTAVAKCQNPVFATINGGLSAFFKQAFSNLVRANIVPPVQYSQKPNTASRVIHCGLYLWIIHTIKQGYYCVILVPAALRAGGLKTRRPLTASDKPGILGLSGVHWKPFLPRVEEEVKAEWSWTGWQLNPAFSLALSLSCALAKQRPSSQARLIQRQSGCTLVLRLTSSPPTPPQSCSLQSHSN